MVFQYALVAYIAITYSISKPTIRYDIDIPMDPSLMYKIKCHPCRHVLMSLKQFLPLRRDQSLTQQPVVTVGRQMSLCTSGRAIIAGDNFVLKLLSPEAAKTLLFSRQYSDDCLLPQPYRIASHCLWPSSRGIQYKGIIYRSSGDQLKNNSII